MKKLFLVLSIACASALFAQDGRIPNPEPTPVPTPTPEEVDPILEDYICKDLLVSGITKSGRDPSNYEIRLSKSDSQNGVFYNTYVVTNLATKAKTDITVAVMFQPHDSSKDGKHI